MNERTTILHITDRVQIRKFIFFCLDLTLEERVQMEKGRHTKRCGETTKLKNSNDEHNNNNKDIRQSSVCVFVFMCTVDWVFGYFFCFRKKSNFYLKLMLLVYLSQAIIIARQNIIKEEEWRGIFSQQNMCRDRESSSNSSSTQVNDITRSTS